MYQQPPNNRPPQQPYYPPQPPRMETMTRTYKTPHAYQHDQQHLARQGWIVQSSTSHQPRSSIGRLIFVPFALFRPPKPTIVVTYQRVRYQ